MEAIIIVRAVSFAARTGIQSFPRIRGAKIGRRNPPFFPFITYTFVPFFPHTHTQDRRPKNKQDLLCGECAGEKRVHTKRDPNVRVSGSCRFDVRSFGT